MWPLEGARLAGLIEDGFLAGEPAAPWRRAARTVTQGAREAGTSPKRRRVRVHDERRGPTSGEAVVGERRREGRTGGELVIANQLHAAVAPREGGHAVGGGRRPHAIVHRISGPRDGAVAEAGGQLEQRQPGHLVGDRRERPEPRADFDRAAPRPVRERFQRRGDRHAGCRGGDLEEAPAALARHAAHLRRRG